MRKDGLFQYHTERSISNIGRAVCITISTRLKGVNLNKLVVGCEVRSEMTKLANNIGLAKNDAQWWPRWMEAYARSVLQVDAPRTRHAVRPCIFPMQTFEHIDGHFDVLVNISRRKTANEFRFIRHAHSSPIARACLIAKFFSCSVIGRFFVRSR